MQSTEIPDSMPWLQLDALVVTIFRRGGLDAPTKQRYHELYARAKKDQFNGIVTLDNEARQLLGARLSSEDLVWPIPWSPTIVQRYDEYTQRKGQSTEHGEGLMSLEQFATIQVMGEQYKASPGTSWKYMSDAERETYLTPRPGPSQLLREDGGIPNNAETGGEELDMEQVDRWIQEISDMEAMLEDDDEE